MLSNQSELLVGRSLAESVSLIKNWKPVCI
jgi:hypothetical protein